MAAEDNGPSIHLPNAGELSNFLEGTDQGDALDTAVAADNAANEPEETTEPEPQGDTFDRKYVEKLRRENASYRERAKKYESVFEGYEDQAVEEWKHLISGFKNDPKTVAEQMKELADQVLGQYTEEEKEQIAEAVQDGEQVPLTRAEFDKLMKERESQWEMDSLVKDIEQEATALGYNLKSREYKVLLMTAQDLPSGSIQEAHEMLLAERQKYIDAEIERLEKEAGGYRRPSSTVGVPSGETPIKDFKGAKDALDQFLTAQGFGRR